MGSSGPRTLALRRLGALRRFLALLVRVSQGFLPLRLTLLAEGLELLGRTFLLCLALVLPAIIADQHADELLRESDRLVRNAAKFVQINLPYLHGAPLVV